MQLPKKVFKFPIAVLGITALTSPLHAQRNVVKHHKYELVEIGTFGGPNSYIFTGARSLNNNGTATGGADTPTSVDPFCLNDCFLAHTFLWQNGTVTDLGGLPGVTASQSLPNDINADGVVAGIAFTGGIDPIIDFPQFDAVVWKDGHIIDLGTFGGTFSYANAINNHNQAVGFALNTTPASFDLGDFCFNFQMPTEMRAFIWENGSKLNLGTLGGTDSCALYVNERSQAAGHSFTDSIVNPVTGFPTVHPFLWDHGRMLDLGTLGGTIAVAGYLNNRGQVVGNSNLAGDSTAHPFLWERGLMKDLGTLGGNFGFASFVSDSGHIVGGATIDNDQAFLAFVWKDGRMIGLGPLPGDDCSVANRVNSRGQVVGVSFPCAGGPSRAVLWDSGSTVDLNTFVPAGSELQLTEPTSINDSGEIAVQAVLPSGDTRAVLLVPTTGDEGETEPTTIMTPSASTTPRNVPQSAQTTEEMIAALQTRFGKRHQIPAMRNPGN